MCVLECLCSVLDIIATEDIIDYVTSIISWSLSYGIHDVANSNAEITPTPSVLLFALLRTE